MRSGCLNRTAKGIVAKRCYIVWAHDRTCHNPIDSPQKDLFSTLIWMNLVEIFNTYKYPLNKIIPQKYCQEDILMYTYLWFFKVNKKVHLFSSFLFRQVCLSLTGQRSGSGGDHFRPRESPILWAQCGRHFWWTLIAIGNNFEDLFGHVSSLHDGGHC